MEGVTKLTKIEVGNQRSEFRKIKRSMVGNSGMMEFWSNAET